MANEIKADLTVDITDCSCPYTIVKTRVALDDLKVGETIEVILEKGVPERNIPKVLVLEGNEILETRDNNNGTITIFAKKIEG